MENILKNKIFLVTLVSIIAITVGYFIVTFQIKQQQKIGYTNLQNECVVQSKKFVDNLQSISNDMTYGYKSHYDIGLNRCYILLHGTGVSGTGISNKLIDIYNNNVVADCESYITAPELNFCNYNGSKILYNLDNFNNFIKPYMESQ